MGCHRLAMPEVGDIAVALGTLWGCGDAVGLWGSAVGLWGRCGAVGTPR